jgi:hypothetical protein
MRQHAVRCAACRGPLGRDDQVVVATPYVEERVVGTVVGAVLVATRTDGQRVIVHRRHFPPDRRRWRTDLAGPLHELVLGID